MVIYYTRKNDVCICHTKTTPPLVGSCTQNIIPDLINFTAKAW